MYIHIYKAPGTVFLHCFLCSNSLTLLIVRGLISNGHIHIYIYIRDVDMDATVYYIKPFCGFVQILAQDMQQKRNDSSRYVSHMSLHAHWHFHSCMCLRIYVCLAAVTTFCSQTNIYPRSLITLDRGPYQKLQWVRTPRISLHWACLRASLHTQFRRGFATWPLLKAKNQKSSHFVGIVGIVQRETKNAATANTIGSGWGLRHHICKGSEWRRAFARFCKVHGARQQIDIISRQALSWYCHGYKSGEACHYWGRSAYIYRAM